LAGMGASTRDNNCSKIIKTAINIPVALRARNRETSRDGLTRLSRDVLMGPECYHVIVLFGNNDSWLRDDDRPEVSLAEFEQNLNTMISQIRHNGQAPILLNLQPLDRDKFLKRFPIYRDKMKLLGSDPVTWQKQYSELVQNLAAKGRVDFIDIRTPMEKEITSCIGDDGLHPNDLGHKLIAEVVLGYLKSVDSSIVVRNSSSR